jgi:PASTA domain/Protein of unknown function (DUF2510)
MADAKAPAGWYEFEGGAEGEQGYWDGERWTGERRTASVSPVTQERVEAADETAAPATSSPPAGWYPDPERPEGERYWEGGRWTDQRRMAPAAAGDPPSGGTRSRFFSWVSRKPKLAFWTTLALSALLGIAIGAAANTNQTVQDQLDSAKRDLSTARAAQQRAESRLSTARSNVATLGSQIKDLTAQGKVPDFTGRTLAQAQTLSRAYAWNLKTTQAPSSAKEGTIIAQSVDSGTVLDRGQSITVTLAFPPPKQWTTIQSFSGSTDQKTNEFQIPSGKVQMAYSFGGNVNDIVDLLHPGQPSFAGDNLVNAIGSKSGTTRIYAHPGTYYLDVSGSNWSIQIQEYK